MATIQAVRYHDISCGHRVVGHEGKCRFLHGHNYRIHFSCEANTHGDIGLDRIGRVIDFGVIKTSLCAWLETEWDHKFLVWEQDREMDFMLAGLDEKASEYNLLNESLVWVPFNPTAENIGLHLLNVVGPRLLDTHAVHLTQVIVEETAKCRAEVGL